MLKLDSGPARPGSVDIRCPARIVATVVLMAATTWRPLAADGAEFLGDLTGPWQLFVDDYLVAARSNVVRTYHPFQKYGGNPVITPTEAWEDSIVYIYGTVLPDGAGGYRMWYHTLRPEDNNNDGSNILYATSTDGIHWVKPILNIRSWHGSTANNMIYDRPGQSGITSVMHTPWETPDKQYQFMNFDIGGYWGAYSPDGVHTNDLPTNPVLTGGDVGQFMYDPRTDLFHAYVKVNSYVNGLKRRSVGHCTTTDISTWPPLELILEPDAYDDRWVPAGTVQRTHFYGLSAFAYESMYMGLLWIFRATDADGYYIGNVYTEIVSSHDGVHWTREEAPRPAMLPLGPAGAWDDGQLYTARSPVRVGNELWIYYGACDNVHGYTTKLLNCSIGLATLRKDGFASLDAGATPGTVTTRSLAGAAGPLRVNYRAVGGSLRVEVLDANGSVLPGYGQADCIALTGDSVDEMVTWTGHTELPVGAGPIRLRFLLQNASIYSFMAGESVQVLDPPNIVQHPQNRTVVAGGTTTFAVQAVGAAPLSYQWRKNGANLSDGGHYTGATTSSLTVSNADVMDIADYSCVVANAYGSATSNSGRLTLLVGTFAGVGAGSTVTGMTADGSVVCGTNAGHAFIWTPDNGLRDLGVPAGATTSSAAGVGLYNGSVVVAVDSNRSTSRAQKWQGNTAGVGSFSALPRIGGSREWIVAALGTNGTSDLWIAGSSINGGDGNGREAVRYQQSTNTTTVVALPASPAGAHDHSDFYGVSDGGVAVGKVQYPGTAPTGGARQAWYNDGSSSVMLNTLLGAPVSTVEAVARCVSRDGLVKGGWSYYSGGGSLQQPVIWQNVATPRAIPFIPGGDGDNYGEVLALNGDGTLAGGYTRYSSGTSNGPKEAFVWDATNGTRQLQGVLTGEYGVDLTGWSLEEVRAISTDGTVLAGNGLHNGVVEGWVFRTAPYVIQPPTITSHPQPQSLCRGATARFDVTASGEGMLAYRWQKNGADLGDDSHYSGTGTSSLTVSDVDWGDEADYRCLVSNAGGSAMSNAASLTLRGGAIGDLDADCDVDVVDFALFQACFNGPNRPPAFACTVAADFDVDLDVDLADFGMLQACFNGPNRPPACPG